VARERHPDAPRRIVGVGAGGRKSRHLRKILELDPERDAQQIAYIDTVYEFPFDTTRSLEFALFRTFGSPAISKLLDSTGEFAQRAQRRYDDTDLILSTIVEAGYDSEAGRRAIRRMNRLHGRFEIANEDFLYVLSTFVFEPVRWNERFGWRPLVEQERLAAYFYWREVGRRMAIKDIPGSYEDFERYNVEYERANFGFAESNRRVAMASRDMFLAWFPGVPRRLGSHAIAALMDERLREALGFPRPPRALVRAVESGLRARALAVRMLPPRRRPKLRTELRHRTYPGGHRIEALGPMPPDVA
jgi:ER-bound oxygenase mpaB/B'/Rubber oxygenase, catalytic domain